MLHKTETCMLYAGIMLELPFVYQFLNSIPLPGIEKPGAVADRLEAYGERASGEEQGGAERQPQDTVSEVVPGRLAAAILR